jgi:non-ribosomal peptide synthetase component F
MSIVNSSVSVSEIQSGSEWSSQPSAGVHRRVAQRAAENANALAVSSTQEDLAYGELDGRANRLANYLRSIGVGRNVVVGLYIERSPAMAIAALAILKAGGAYLPLDPIHPPDRLAFMLKDSQACAVVSTKSLMAGFPNGAWQVVTLDGDADKIAAQPDTQPIGDVTGDDLAYIIYTSGSTGQPKGV